MTRINGARIPTKMEFRLPLPPAYAHSQPRFSKVTRTRDRGNSQASDPSSFFLPDAQRERERERQERQPCGGQCGGGGAQWDGIMRYLARIPKEGRHHRYARRISRINVTFTPGIIIIILLSLIRLIRRSEELQLSLSSARSYYIYSTSSVPFN
jgi:hypothetical protein